MTPRVQCKPREGNFMEAPRKGGCKGFIWAKLEKIIPMQWPGKNEKIKKRKEFPQS